MTAHRWDETWHRLREWTSGQAQSERLAAQILLAEEFSALDPSHPLGGKDGGKDAICLRHGERWVMGVYFPRGQQSFKVIKEKYSDDLASAVANDATGFAFVTNQELKLSERSKLMDATEELHVELYHLERLTTILDRPALAATRKQFLGIDYLEENVSRQLEHLQDKLLAAQKRTESMQTGGDSFCYFMLYHFDLGESVAKNIAIIRKGEFPLNDLRFRVTDMNISRDIFRQNWGELNSPADYLLEKWPLKPRVYYRIFFHARNGSWNQDLILRRSDEAQCWLAATRVLAPNGRDVTLTHIDNDFETSFGEPLWRM